LISEFFVALIGFFKFFDEVNAYIKVLQKTPIEQHESLVAAIQAEAKRFEDEGRPTWS
jgi:hypothetical protein